MFHQSQNSVRQKYNQQNNIITPYAQQKNSEYINEDNYLLQSHFKYNQNKSQLQTNNSQINQVQNSKQYPNKQTQVQFQLNNDQKIQNDQLTQTDLYLESDKDIDVKLQFQQKQQEIQNDQIQQQKQNQSKVLNNILSSDDEQEDFIPPRRKIQLKSNSVHIQDNQHYQQQNQQQFQIYNSIKFYSDMEKLDRSQFQDNYNQLEQQLDQSQQRWQQIKQQNMKIFNNQDYNNQQQQIFDSQSQPNVSIIDNDLQKQQILSKDSKQSIQQDPSISIQTAPIVVIEQNTQNGNSLTFSEQGELINQKGSSNIDQLHNKGVTVQIPSEDIFNIIEQNKQSQLLNEQKQQIVLEQQQNNEQQPSVLQSFDQTKDQSANETVEIIEDPIKQQNQIEQFSLQHQTTVERQDVQKELQPSDLIANSNQNDQISNSKFREPDNNLENIQDSQQDKSGQLSATKSNYNKFKSTQRLNQSSLEIKLKEVSQSKQSYDRKKIPHQDLFKTKKNKLQVQSSQLSLFSSTTESQIEQKRVYKSLFNNPQRHIQ